MKEPYSQATSHKESHVNTHQVLNTDVSVPPFLNEIHGPVDHRLEVASKHLWWEGRRAGGREL